MNAKERQKRYFNIADSVSQLSNHPKAKLGCIVVKNKQILSSGHNSNTKTHRIQGQLDKIRFSEPSTCKLHSETACLLPLIRNKTDLSKAELYISRKHKDGTLAMSRPCKSCMALMRSCGIRTIHYTTEDGYAAETLED